MVESEYHQLAIPNELIQALSLSSKRPLYVMCLSEKEINTVIVLSKGLNMSLIKPLNLPTHLQKINRRTYRSFKRILNQHFPGCIKCCRSNGSDSSTDKLLRAKQWRGNLQITGTEKHANFFFKLVKPAISRDVYFSDKAVKKAIKIKS